MSVPDLTDKEGYFAIAIAVRAIVLCLVEIIRNPSKGSIDDIPFKNGSQIQYQVSKLKSFLFHMA